MNFAYLVVTIWITRDFAVNLDQIKSIREFTAFLKKSQM